MRNEVDGLPCLLAAVAAQALVATHAMTLCLFFDGCTDGSRRLVEQSAPGLGVGLALGSGTEHGLPNAGRARAAAMALGLQALGDDGILLTTDADSVPARDWVAASVAALGHADLVAGRIVRGGAACTRQDRVEAYYDRLHALRRVVDPVPWEAAATHHHTGGANLGFRASAYRALGGFAPVPCGEDARITDDAARAGFRVRRDADSIVATSSRRDGRAAGGLAAQLRAFDQGNAAMVGHPEDMLWQYRLHAVARRAFDACFFTDIAAAIGLTGDHALGVARDCPNGEAFAMRIVPAPPAGMRAVSLGEAEALLRVLDTPPLKGAA